MPFNQIANRQVEFSGVTGTVISSQKHSETHVRSSGGGGYIHQGSGHVSAPTITSHVVTKHEFWVRTENGRDVPVNLSNVPVSVAEGQTVSLVSGSVSGLSAAPIVLIVNHNAGAHWFIPPASGFINAMHEPIKLWPFAVMLGIFLLFLATRVPFVGLVGFGFSLWRLLRRRSLVKASTARLARHVEAIAQSVHSGRALPQLAPLPPATGN